MADDLAESTDLSTRHPEIFRRLEKEYATWTAEVNAHPTGPEIDPNVSATPPK